MIHNLLTPDTLHFVTQLQVSDRAAVVMYRPAVYSGLILAQMAFARLFWNGKEVRERTKDTSGFGAKPFLSGIQRAVW